MGHCTFHPTNAVDGICLRCNSGICRDCICTFRDRPYCTRCILSVKQQHDIFRQTMIWIGLFAIFGGSLSAWAWWGISQLPSKPTAKDAGAIAKADAGNRDASVRLPPLKTGQRRKRPPLSPQQKRLLEQYRKGCEQDKAKDCVKFARLVLRSPEQLRLQLSMRALQQACRLKYAKACGELAQFFSLGIGVPQNHRMAAQFFQRGCSLGSRRSCTSLGTLYAASQTLGKQLPKAHRLFEKACKMKDPHGCRKLGLSYSAGFLGKKNPGKAKRILRKTCKTMRDAASCFVLGKMYQKGVGVRANTKRAKRLIKQACDMGYEAACQ